MLDLNHVLVSRRDTYARQTPLALNTAAIATALLHDSQRSAVSATPSSMQTTVQ
jgi:hypothetical protein